MPFHVRLTSGKAEHLKRRHPDGREEYVCLCRHNADVSKKGCISQVHGPLLDEVLSNNGKYLEGNIRIYRKQGILDNRCYYCYGIGGRRGNWGAVTPKQVTDLTRQDFKREKPEIVRIGKITEAGHFFYRNVLTDTLNLCREYGSQVIMIAKALDFDPRVAEILRETDSVVHISNGYDIMEPGAVSQGFTNEWRMEQARKYMDAGVNTTLTVVCDVVQSLDKNVELGSPLEKAIELEQQYGLTKRVMPLRINSNKVSQIITGQNIRDITQPKPKKIEGQTELALDVQEEERLYGKRGNNERYPRVFHPDFQKLLESGTGFCGRIGDYEYCDKCNLQGDTRIEFPVEQIIPVQYDRKNKLRKRKRTNKNQLKLN